MGGTYLKTLDQGLQGGGHGLQFACGPRNFPSGEKNVKEFIVCQTLDKI